MSEWLGTLPLAFSYKLNRAEMHLDTLRNEVSEFVKNYPCRVGRQVSAKDNTLWFHYIADIETYPPLMEWGCLIGDVVHNIRSALDNLVYSHVTARGRQTPQRRTEFPIFRRKDKFLERGIRRNSPINAQALTIIKSLQPYHRGKDYFTHPLWMIHELNNFDKHSIINVCAWAVRDPEFEVVRTTDDVVILSQQVIQSGQPIQHGTLLAELVARGWAAKSNVQVKNEFPPDIAFFQAGPTAGGFVIPRLTELLEFVRNEVFGPLVPVLEAELRTWPRYHERPLLHRRDTNQCG